MGPGASSETRRLAAKMRQWATQAREKPTFKKYRTPWRRWILWAVERTKRGELTPILPANEFHVALFLTALAEKFPTAKTVVSTAVTAINFSHRFNGFDEPYGHTARAVNEGVRRAWGRPKKKARPLTTFILRKVVQKWGKKEAPLWQNMMATMMVLGFATFCRLEELAGLFRTIWRRSKRVTGECSLGDKKIGSTVYHRYFRLALTEAAGISPQRALLFSGHSMRRGGATAAALAKIPAHLRMSHGRWVDQRCADSYVGVPQQVALEVTSAIGL